jgi:hypothetical protein
LEISRRNKQEQLQYEQMKLFLLLLSCASCSLVSATVLDYEALGAIPDDESYDTMLHNGNLLNTTLVGMISGDVFLVPNKT